MTWQEKAMERLVESVVQCSAILVPLLAIWAIAGLYTIRTGCKCLATEIVYYVVLLLVAAVTIRTVITDHNCWLIHTASLGVMVVAGVMRRPVGETDPFGGSDTQLLAE